MHVPCGLGFITLARVMVLIVLASALWVPVGVWLGLRPHWAKRVQPVAQFLAAFPANLFFPVFVVAIVRFHLVPDIWLTPLMILGHAMVYFVQRDRRHRRLPGRSAGGLAQFPVSAAGCGGGGWSCRASSPYFVTGALTASGGAWNAAICGRMGAMGQHHADRPRPGRLYRDRHRGRRHPRVVLGVVVMSLFVVTINRLLWRPLAAYCARRLTF